MRKLLYAIASTMVLFMFAMLAATPEGGWNPESSDYWHWYKPLFFMAFFSMIGGICLFIVLISSQHK
jgi:hypothetical protein